jgi:hypothetical protein
MAGLTILAVLGAITVTGWFLHNLHVYNIDRKALWGFLAPRPQVTVLTLPVSGNHSTRSWPATMRGQTYAVLSDFHFEGEGAATSDSELLRSMIARIRERQVHGVFLLGDFVQRSPAHVDQLCRDYFALLTGTPIYAVLGNHDDPDAVAALLERCHIRVLDNETVPLDAGVWLAGFGDLYRHRFHP